MGVAGRPPGASLLNMNIEVGNVILSEAKNLCVASEILRFAQNDRSIPVLVVNVHRYHAHLGGELERLQHRLEVLRIGRIKGGLQPRLDIKNGDEGFMRPRHQLSAGPACLPLLALRRHVLQP